MMMLITDNSSFPQLAGLHGTNVWLGRALLGHRQHMRQDKGILDILSFLSIVESSFAK